MTDTTTPNDYEIKFSWPVVILVLLVVFALWLVTPFVMIGIGLNLAERGLAGDQYGSTNALFSGLAFAGVIIAILLQREELALQRKELRASVKAQDQAQKALTQTLWAQNFKVVLDIIEAPEIITARGVLYTQRDDFRKDRKDWSQQMIDKAQDVARSFEGAGTIIRNGLLPREYLSGWTMPALRCWDIIGEDILRLRVVRKDPFLGRDFEWLVGELTRLQASEELTDSRSEAERSSKHAPL
jgi:hypothetical protein